MPTDPWELSRPIRRTGKSSLFPDDGRRRPQLFVASFEGQTGRPDEQMSLLLGWEYGRSWLRERNEFLRHDTFNAKRRFIPPDYNWWLRKRQLAPHRPKLLRRPLQPAMGQQPNYAPTAFAVPKKSRPASELQQQQQQQQPENVKVQRTKCKWLQKCCPK